MKGTQWKRHKSRHCRWECTLEFSLNRSKWAPNIRIYRWWIQCKVCNWTELSYCKMWPYVICDKCYCLWYVFLNFNVYLRLTLPLKMEAAVTYETQVYTDAAFWKTDFFFYICVSVHHKSIIYNKPARCNSGSIVFIKNYKYVLHLSFRVSQVYNI